MPESLRQTPEESNSLQEHRDAYRHELAEPTEETDTEPQKQSTQDDTSSDSSSKIPKDSNNQVFENVTIVYDGLFAKQMSWNLESIAAYLKDREVESRVFLERGSNRPGQADQENLGWVAAWKSLGNPLDYFSSKHATEMVEVIVHPNLDVHIKLHDQEIMFNLAEKEKTKESFIRKCNELVRESLSQAAKEVNKKNAAASLKEHQHMIKYIGVSGAFSIVAVGTNNLISWLTEMVNVKPLTFGSSVNTGELILYSGVGIAATAAVAFATMAILEQWMLIRHGVESPFRFWSNRLKASIDQVFSKKVFVSPKK